MPKAVKSLGQFVAVHGHHRGVVTFGGLFDDFRKLVQLGDDVLFGSFQGMVTAGRAQVGISGFVEHGIAAHDGILHVWPGLSLQVYRLFGVKDHAFFGVHLDDKKLQSRYANLADDLLLGFRAEVGQGTAFFAIFPGFVDHFVDQVVGVNYGAFPRFHFAAGQVHHAVGKVVKPPCVRFAQAFHDFKKHLKMVVLFVGNDVDHFFSPKILVPHLSGTDVLGDVYRGAVFAQHQFFVQFGVF